MIKPFYKFPSFEDLVDLNSSLKAVFFDMDGTLLHTEPLHEKVFVKMGEDYKITPPNETIPLMTGLSDQQVYNLTKSWPGFPPNLSEVQFIEEKNHRMLKMIPSIQTSTIMMDNCVQLLRDLRKNKMITGLVTSSEKIITEALLQHVELMPFFDFIITRQDVINPKPDPQAYLLALEKSGKNINQCLVFEDSIPGIQAAQFHGLLIGKALWWEKA
jgi:HAD superfamily hydrolase (TIGR01509 family)